ncbi:MAG: hypothetical protein IIB61_08575, partial [Planctomycetes bacterium]|nr:hypothetical protein [Planctomycetota bacterium]
MARPNGATGVRTSVRRERRLIFLLFFCLYAASACGDLTSDSEIRWATARQLLDTGWFDLPTGITNAYADGIDGRQYAFYAPGQSICLIPFVVAGRWIAAMGLPISGTADMFGQFLASVGFFPVCGALIVVLTFAIVFQATGSRRDARWIAFALGAASMHWHHTAAGADESQVGLCVLLAVWAIQRVWHGGGWHCRLLVCGAMGVAVSFRYSAATFGGAIILAGLTYDLARQTTGSERLRRLWSWLLAACLGLVPICVALGWFNAVRFGSWAETGYGPAHLERIGGVGLFETPLWFGLTGMLFSPGKGVFLFNPPLILAVYGAVRFWREFRGLALIVVAAFLGSVLFHSTYTFWGGDFTWGPRYLTSIMGLLLLPLIPVIRRPRQRSILIALCAISVCIQAASVVYSYALEFYQDRRHGIIPDSYVWRPAESQLFCRFENIALHA